MRDFGGSVARGRCRRPESEPATAGGFEHVDGVAPHAGPVVNSPEELQARLRAREAAEPQPSRGKPYLVHDPIIAEIHRNREVLYRERQAETLILKDEPPRKKR